MTRGEVWLACLFGCLVFWGLVIAAVWGLVN